MTQQRIALRWDRNLTSASTTLGAVAIKASPALADMVTGTSLDAVRFVGASAVVAGAVVHLCVIAGGWPEHSEQCE